MWKNWGWKLLPYHWPWQTYGVVEFYKTAKAGRVILIPGWLAVKIDVAGDSGLIVRPAMVTKPGIYHLILLAEKQYRLCGTLWKSLPLGLDQGYYYRPLVWILITLINTIRDWSACRRVWREKCRRWFLRLDFMKRQKALQKKYQDCFGKDNYFLELQDHGIPDQKTVNQGLLSDQSGTGTFPLSARTISSYTYETDVEVHTMSIRWIPEPVKKKRLRMKTVCVTRADSFS